MAKRITTEVVVEPPPLKRLKIDSTPTPTDQEPTSGDDEDDDHTTAQTPVSDVPSSPATGVTTPRAKFPSDLKKLPCTWPGCPKTFNRPARLRDHLNSHVNNRPFKCPYPDCDKDYTVDKHLKQHVKATHTNERKHVCEKDGCGKSFVTGTRLRRHQLVHEGEERFKCKDCGQSFRKKDTLSKHVRKEHEGLPSFACPEKGCNAAFDHRQSLRKHQEKEHGEAKFWCEECGVTTNLDGTEQRVGFTTKYLLEAHTKSEHQQCMFCDFKSSRQWPMEQHVEMYHSGKSLEERKNKPCPFPDCEARFTKQSNLNSHIRTVHEGLRFVCGQTGLDNPDLEGWTPSQGCGEVFSAKGRLVDHVRYVHLGRPRQARQLPTSADQEAAEVSQADRFIDSLFSNISAAKPVPCAQCASTYNSQAELDVHVAMDHDLPMLDDAPLQPLFGEDEAAPSIWHNEMDEEEIFSAEMDYGPVDDDWAEDEANIMLLARDSVMDEHIDPALGEP